MIRLVSKINDKECRYIISANEYVANTDSFNF
jgi:hypothetical protein